MKNTLMAIALAGLTATGAAASTITVEKQVADSIWKSTENSTYWGIGTDISVNGTVRNNVGAGAFQVKADFGGTVKTFIAFCLEPLEYLRLANPYHEGSNFSTEINERLQLLAVNALGLITDKFTAAAFQMAAWELVTETSGPYSLTDGDFKVVRNQTASNNARDIGNGWLENISNGTWVRGTGSFMIYNGEGTQDLLTNLDDPTGGPVVPLPAGGILLLSALGAAGVVRARRKTA